LVGTRRNLRWDNPQITVANYFMKHDTSLQQAPDGVLVPFGVLRLEKGAALTPLLVTGASKAEAESKVGFEDGFGSK
jgi:hypothetical protein